MLESGLTKRTLTEKQRTVFEFIQRYVAEHRRAPLIREVQDGCQIVSYKSAIDRLNALEHKQLIRRIPNKHRGIRLVHPRQRAESAQSTPPVPEPAMGQRSLEGAV